MILITISYPGQLQEIINSKNNNKNKIWNNLILINKLIKILKFYTK